MKLTKFDWLKFYVKNWKYHELEIHYSYKYGFHILIRNPFGYRIIL